MLSRAKCKIKQLVNSSRYTEFGIVSAWLFLGMTCLSFCLAAKIIESPGTYLNLGFNVIYTFFYLAFLSAFRVLHVKPQTIYVLGIILYTLGYILFVTLYFLYTIRFDHDPTLQQVYLWGSLTFLIGSGMLVYSTIPTGSWWGRDSSLFWGSLSFLVGSILFTIDAYQGVSAHSYLLIVWGYGFFVVGRFFFIVGSTTVERDAFLRLRS